MDRFGFHRIYEQLQELQRMSVRRLHVDLGTVNKEGRQQRKTQERARCTRTTSFCFVETITDPVRSTVAKNPTMLQLAHNLAEQDRRADAKRW